MVYGEHLMDMRSFTRPFLTLLLLGSINSSSRSQQEQCANASTPPSSLNCAFGVMPLSIQPLTSGAPYVAVTDQTQTPYATYLYPDQSNQMPAQHRIKGEAIAATIQPLDGNGNVDFVNGRILAIAEGMSNTRDEMIAFTSLLLTKQSELNPQFQFISLAEGGCDLECWVGKGVGATDSQVQVAFLKHSNNRPQNADGSPKQPSSNFPNLDSKRFPAHAVLTKGLLKTRILAMKKKYPNLKLVFITSRSYGGWSCAPSAVEYREPVAFEEGFSVKWLIDDQILGADPDLAFEGNNPPAPWLAWGPYLWNRDWTQDMFRADGTHPCDKGTMVVAQMWYDSLSTYSTSRSWFRNLSTPVELALFRASSAGAGVLLEWMTESEFTNFGFEIERRRHGGRDTNHEAWQKIGFVQGNGTTTSQRRYSYLDRDLSPGRYNYRLKQLDLDGGFQYSGSVEIEVGRPGGFALFQNFPNPTYGRTAFRYSLREKSDVTLTIFNLQGQKVKILFKGFADAGVYKVDWNGLDDHRRSLPSGTYLYRLQAGDFAETKRLMLVR